MDALDTFLDSDKSWDEIQGVSAPSPVRPPLVSRADPLDTFLDSDKPWGEDESTFFERIGQAWDTGEAQSQIGNLRYRQLVGDDTDELRGSIEQIKATMPKRAGIKRSLPERAIAAAAEMMPIQIEGLKKGAERGLKLGMGAGAIAAIAGQAGPQVAFPEEIITVPGAFAGMYGVGMVSGAIENIGQIEAGLAYDELLDVKDDKGEGINPAIAKGAAAGVGIINGLIEMAQIKLLLKTIPGGEKLLTGVIRDATKKAVTNKTLKGLALRYAGKYGMFIGAETAQEIAQESTNIIAGEIAKTLTNKLDKTDLPATTKKEVVDRLLETAKQSALAFSVMGVPGTVVSGATEAVRRTPDVSVIAPPPIDEIRTKLESGEHTPEDLEAIKEIWADEPEIVAAVDEMLKPKPMPLLKPDTTPVKSKRPLTVEERLGKRPPTAEQDLRAKLRKAEEKPTPLPEGTREAPEGEGVALVEPEPVVVEKAPETAPIEAGEPVLPDAIEKRDVKGDDLLDAIDRIDDARSSDKTIEIDQEGYVTLYHRTNKANAELIQKSGRMTTKEPGLFFGSKPKGQIDGYGEAVVKVRVPIEKLELNDVFTDEVHFRLPEAMPGKPYKVEVLPIEKPKAKEAWEMTKDEFAGTKPRQFTPAEQHAGLKLKEKEIRKEFKGVKRISFMNRTTPNIARGQEFDKALAQIEAERRNIVPQWESVEKGSGWESKTYDHEILVKRAIEEGKIDSHPDYPDLKPKEVVAPEGKLEERRSSFGIRDKVDRGIMTKEGARAGEKPRPPTLTQEVGPVFGKTFEQIKDLQQKEPTAKPKPVPTTKVKPWDMGKEEYIDHIIENRPSVPSRESNFKFMVDRIKKLHKDKVKQAIDEGKIKSHPDYPGLAAKKPAVKVEITGTKEKEVSVDMPKAQAESLTPKEQKAYLMAEIDKAIEGAKSGERDYTQKPSKWASEKEISETRKQKKEIYNKMVDKFGTVTIRVPGDGDFTILNNKEALMDFKKTVKSFPASAPKPPTARTASIKPLGKRISGIEGEYYNEFKPRKEGIIERKIDPDKPGQAAQWFKDGWFSQGAYVIKTGTKPKLKNPVETKDTPDFKEYLKGSEKAEPATLAGETLLSPSADAAAFYPEVHVVSEDGAQHWMLNAKYVDSILTIYPDAKISMGENGQTYFTKGKEVVGAVMPVRSGEPEGTWEGMGSTVQQGYIRLYPGKPTGKAAETGIMSEKGEVDITAAIEKISKYKAGKKAAAEATERKRAFLEKHYPEKLKPPEPASSLGADESRTTTDAAKEVLNRHFTDFMYWVVDKNRPMQEVQRKLGQISEDIDLFLRETQRPKITAARVRNFWDDSVRPLLKEIARTKKTIPEVEIYAQAKHAHEANKALRLANSKRFYDSANATLKAKDWEGKTRKIEPLTPEEHHKALMNLFAQLKDNEKIKKIKAQWDTFSGKPSGMSDTEATDILNEHKNDADIERLRLMISGINNDRLEILHDAGLIPDEEYEAIRNKYKNYVPLYREGYEDSTSGSGKGLQPAGRPIKTRSGSTRNVVNILSNTVSNYENAVDRAEKAESARVLLSLIQENPNPEMWTIKPQKKTPRHDSYGNLRMYPDISSVSENEIRIMVDGKQYLIEVNRFNRDAMLMLRTLKTQDKSAGPIVNTLAKINRWLARVNTSWSPEFIISNFARDIQTAGINIGDTGVDSKRVFRGAVDGIRAIYNVERDKPTGSEYEKLYDRFKKSGGKIGWADVHDSAESLSKKITRELEMVAGERPIRKTATEWVQWIEDINTSIENGVRLHVFKLATESGKSDIKAAQIASDITVDFTKKGAAGPIINSLYLFANAGIQGSYRIMRASKNPKVIKMMAGIVGLGFTIGFLNSFAGEDDDGEDYYNKIDDFTRERNMIIMLPGTKGKFAKIPLPWGYNFIYNIGTEASMVFTKEDYEPLQGAARLATTFANSFNPVASGTLLQTLAPTVADPFVMVAENKNWFGGDLMPTTNKFAKVPTPDSQRYWKSAGPVSKWTANQLNELTGGSKVRKGVIDVSPETLDLIVDTAGGSMMRFFTDTFTIPAKLLKKEEVKIYEVPFLRRVAGTQSEWADSKVYYSNITKVLTAKEELKAYRGTPQYESLSKELEPLKKLFGVAEDAEKRLRSLRKSKKSVEIINNKERVKFYEDKINKVYVEFNRRFSRKQKTKAGRMPRPSSTPAPQTKYKPLTLREALDKTRR